MSFFIRNKREPFSVDKKPRKVSSFVRKRGAPVVSKTNGKLGKAKRGRFRNDDRNTQFESVPDEEITSGSDFSGDESKNVPESESESEQETAQEKRLRLAKIYLDELEQQEKERNEAKEIDRDVLANRLMEDVLEQAGSLRRSVADKYCSPTSEVKVLQCKVQKLPVTCVVISSDNNYVFTGSKDCTIVKWSMAEKKKLACAQKGLTDKEKGHKIVVLCLSISSDDKFLASGDQNKCIYIWDPKLLTVLHIFDGHRGAVTGLAFRRGSHQLFSASQDRTARVWNLDEMAYVETLFGHQDGLTSVDALGRERAITSGGRDGTIRIWKIVEESQLIYGGHTGSIDCVRLINEEHFVSCGEDGALCLWGVRKKRPLFVVNSAHGVQPENDQPRWITCVAAYQNTDLLASGSCDGKIRLWKCGEHFRTITPVCEISVPGFVNSLAFTSDGKVLVAGLGQEHRLGRWWRLKEAKNGLAIINLVET